MILFQCGLLARAAFRRSVGDFPAAALDLDEVEEIAEPGPMRLFLCDLAMERARLALARREAFAPLNGLVEARPGPPAPPDAAEAARLLEEARAQLAIARKLVAECCYHKRDQEVAELEAVLGASGGLRTCRRMCDAAVAALAERSRDPPCQRHGRLRRPRLRAALRSSAKYCTVYEIYVQNEHAPK